MPRLLSRIAGLLLTMAMAIAMTMAAAAEAPERYEVELIIFRHVDQSRNTAEIPAASSIFHPSPLDLTIAEMQAPVPKTTTGQVIMPGNIPSELPRRAPIRFYILELNPAYPDFVPMRDETRSLNRVYKRLERIDAYEPIAHVGWIQPARDTDSTKTFRFPSSTTGSTTGSTAGSTMESTVGATGITGTITLYKERFLHLEVDLTLETEKSPVETWSFLGAGENDSPDIYKLTESRRIQGSAMHYFDHPQFGVIARIQQVKTSTNAREENG